MVRVYTLTDHGPPPYDLDLAGQMICMIQFMLPGIVCMIYHMFPGLNL